MIFKQNVEILFEIPKTVCINLFNLQQTAGYDCLRCKISVRTIVLHNELGFTYLYYINISICHYARTILPIILGH